MATLETTPKTALARAAAPEAAGVGGAPLCALLLYADLTRDTQAGASAASAAESEPSAAAPVAELTHGFSGQKEARRLRPSWAALRQLSSKAHGARFARLVMDGDVAQAEAFLQTLQAQDGTVAGGLLAELARLLESRNSGVEVACGSLAVKVHGLLLEDEPGSLAQKLEYNDLERDVFLSFCRLEAWKAAPPARLAVSIASSRCCRHG